ncbi:UDP-xylose transporter 3-like [Triticum dicoccoides]|nr:UDP-xylose transporter 3-like [Triticum dicoccoides]XP_044401044.1 UDP-xylose transporter 3-like [Triticum aestivum]
MKPFKHKPFDARTVMGFGVLNGILIGLLNQSLGFNSVGFYQSKSSALVGSSFLILQRTRQKIYRVLGWLRRFDKRHKWITTSLDIFRK